MKFIKRFNESKKTMMFNSLEDELESYHLILKNNNLEFTELDTKTNTGGQDWAFHEMKQSDNVKVSKLAIKYQNLIDSLWDEDDGEDDDFVDKVIVKQADLENKFLKELYKIMIKNKY